MRAIKDTLLYAGVEKTLYTRLKTTLMEKNRQSLCISSFIGFFVMIGMLIASRYQPFLAANRLLYEISIALFVALYLLARFIRSKTVTAAVMYAFEIGLLAFGIALGTWINPSTMSVSFIAMLFMLPLLFCDRPINTMLLIAASIVLYFICAYQTQTHEVLMWNVSNIVPFGLLSLGLCPYIINLKIDHVIVTQQRRRLKGVLPIGDHSSSDQLKTMVNFVQVIMNYHTDETLLHCKRVGQYSRLLCRAYNFVYHRAQRKKLFTDEEIEMIGVGAELHDIGKIYIPDSVLHKKTALTDEEWDIIKNHTVVGSHLIGYVAAICHTDSTILDNIIRYHHERWDGSGYPEHLKGDSIPLEAQLVAIAEVYDALTAENYSQKRTHSEAFRMIMSGECGAFGPEALNCLEAARNDFHIITENKEQGRWDLLQGVYAKNGKTYWRIKRGFDILASAAALVVLSPVFLAIAAWIKLDDPHSPVIFKQERLGRHKKPFVMYKFRTMVPNAEQLLKELQKENEKDGPVFKIKKDPRITRPGAFLRKTSLDELPQLVNVLKGDMTVVGPRPPLPSEVEKYSRYHEMRLSVTPGLTCYWQTHDSRDDVSFEEWMDMDIAYIGTRSVWTDIKIILRTVMIVLKGAGN